MIGKIQAKRKKPDAEEPLIGLWSAFSLKLPHYNGEGCINTFPSMRDYRSNYPWRFSKKTNLRASALRIACLFRYVKTLCYSQKMFTAYQLCVASPFFVCNAGFSETACAEIITTIDNHEICMQNAFRSAILIRSRLVPAWHRRL